MFTLASVTHYLSVNHLSRGESPSLVWGGGAEGREGWAAANEMLGFDAWHNNVV